MRNTVLKFWECIAAARYEDLAPLFVPQATVLLPNTGERFDDPQHYIAFNRSYPGRWGAEVVKLHDCGPTVISTVKVWSLDDASSYFVTSYFEFEGGRIGKIEEFWGEVALPPEWRRG